MPKIFREFPPVDIVNQILQTLGIHNIHDATWFSKAQIRLQDFEQLLPELEIYYIPCKAQEYLHISLTHSRAITIIRQLLKAHGARLNTCQKSCGGEKGNWYQILCRTHISGLHESQEYQESITLSFD